MHMEDLTQWIVTAAEVGDLQGVVEALTAGASPDAMGPNSGALHTAAFSGYEAVVELLLTRGANPDKADKQGFYPLHLAASKNHVPVMKLLLAKGASVNLTTPQGGTALHVAAASGFPAATTLLIHAGVKLESRDENGNTALATVLSLGNAEIARLLINANAKVLTVNDARETPLIHLARGLKNVRVKSWRHTVETGDAPVDFRIENGYFSQTVHDSKTEVGLNDQRTLAVQPWVPAKHRAYLEACELFEELMLSTPNINGTDQDGHSAFSLICHGGEARLMKALLAAGASPELKHPTGFSTLHLVAGSSRLDALEAYLEKVPGIEINGLDDFGWTPLHYLADIGGDLRMAGLLLGKGANPDAQSTKERGGIPAGSKPSDVAKHWRDKDMAAILGG